MPQRTDHWVFDFSSLTGGDFAAWRDVADKPISEFMNLVSKVVVSGPIDIDWTDRYGWTQLTLNQYTELINQRFAAVADKLRGLGIE
jgi:hypothetical protein